MLIERLTALLAPCAIVLAGCAAENDPFGVSALPTDPSVGLRLEAECCGSDRDAECADDAACGQSRNDEFR
jgi:hypothetical protein